MIIRGPEIVFLIIQPQHSHLFDSDHRIIIMMSINVLYTVIKFRTPMYRIILDISGTIKTRKIDHVSYKYITHLKGQGINDLSYLLKILCKSIFKLYSTF